MNRKSGRTTRVLVVAGFTWLVLMTLLFLLVRACQERVEVRLISIPEGATVYFGDDDDPSDWITPGTIERRAPWGWSHTTVALERNGQVTRGNIWTNPAGLKGGFQSFIHDVDSLDGGAWYYSWFRPHGHAVLIRFPEEGHYLVSYLNAGREDPTVLGEHVDELRDHPDWPAGECDLLKVPAGEPIEVSSDRLSFRAQSAEGTHIALSRQFRSLDAPDTAGIDVEVLDGDFDTALLTTEQGETIDLLQAPDGSIFLGSSFDLALSWPDGELSATLDVRTYYLVNVRVTRSGAGR